MLCELLIKYAERFTGNSLNEAAVLGFCGFASKTINHTSGLLCFPQSVQYINFMFCLSYLFF